MSKSIFLLLASTFCLLSACQSDGYMGRACEGKDIQRGSAEYQACVDTEARWNRREINKYGRSGGP